MESQLDSMMGRLYNYRDRDGRAKLVGRKRRQARRQSVGGYVSRCLVTVRNVIIHLGEACPDVEPTILLNGSSPLEGSTILHDRRACFYAAAYGAL